MRPDYQIRLEGKDITDRWRPYVRSITVSDRTDDGKSDSCVIALNDRNAELEKPEHGKQLEIFLGYVGDDLPTHRQMQSVGKFVVDKIGLAGPPTSMTISGKSAAFTNALNLANIQTKKNRTHENQTVGTLVDAIAKENGLTSDVDPYFRDTNLGTVQQTDESDTHMLSRIAEMLTATFKISDNRMLFLKKGNSSTGNNAEKFSLTASQVSSWSQDDAKAPAYNSCVAVYHDLAAARTFEVTAGSGEPTMRLRNPYPDFDQAMRAAVASVIEAKREGLTITLSMPGRSDIFAGARVLLSEFPYDIPGEWELTEITHTLSASGYSTAVAGKAV